MIFGLVFGHAEDDLALRARRWSGCRTVFEAGHLVLSGQLGFGDEGCQAGPCRRSLRCPAGQVIRAYAEPAGISVADCLAIGERLGVSTTYKTKSINLEDWCEPADKPGRIIIHTSVAVCRRDSKNLHLHEREIAAGNARFNSSACRLKPRYVPTDHVASTDKCRRRTHNEDFVGANSKAYLRTYRKLCQRRFEVDRGTRNLAGHGVFRLAKFTHGGVEEVLEVCWLGQLLSPQRRHDLPRQSFRHDAP
jgi:hypothetical protein